jgi:hypothetical protein
MTGVGFTEQNLRSFFTAYSLNKLKRGSKGIDRLTFLTVFENIEIYVLDVFRRHWGPSSEFFAGATSVLLP